MNPLRIEHMTIFDVEPPEVISIASQLGVPSISLWVSEGGIPGSNPVTAATRREVINRLRDAPVQVETAEVFMLSPDAQQAEATVALAAEIGAQALVAINVLTEDEGIAAQQLADLCELAGRHDLLVYLEPIWMGRTRTPADGMRLIRASGAGNARLVIDALHVVRSGASPSDVAALPPEALGSAQICDGPAQIAPESGIEEATAERGLPGSGDFPLKELLGALPSDLSLGVEVPQRRSRERGDSALERTRRAVDATRRLQRQVADERRS